MNNIKNELQEMFKMEMTVTNMSQFNLNMFIENSKIFKLVKSKEINKMIKRKIEKEGVLFSHIFDAIKTKRFVDYNRTVNVTIYNEYENNSDDYVIILDKVIQEKIKMTINENTNCVTKLETIKEIVLFFDTKLLQIKNLEIEKIKNEIEKLLTKNTFFIRITQEQDFNKLGYMYFLVQDYKKAKINFEKADYCEEMIFYCNIMLNIEHNSAFIYYSNDLFVNLRRIYFIREYLNSLNDNTLIVYYMLNNFEYNNTILKLILETELIIFLSELSNLENRIVLALFNCVNITFEEKLDEICIDYINELKGKDVHADLLTHINELEKQLHDRNFRL